MDGNRNEQRPEGNQGEEKESLRSRTQGHSAQGSLTQGPTGQGQSTLGWGVTDEEIDRVIRKLEEGWTF